MPVTEDDNPLKLREVLMTFSRDRNMYISVEMSKSEFEKLG